jgi:16S rRNA (adenine1518-N6/adenine1519-N6)-dimethyltransferase
MILTSPSVIKKLFKEHDARPFKGLGQNFLINKGILEKIMETVNIKPNETILEIGPGVGTLTKELAKKAGKVVAIEKDDKMVEILKKTLITFKNVEVIKEDALKIDLENQKLRIKKYKIIANLPYNIASRVIRRFLESKNQPKEMILMVQKEVAQRICAKAPDMNLLAASIQFYSKPKILFYVSKNNFWPQSKVDGALVRLRPKDTGQKIDKERFFRVLKAGFSQPRKKISNNLSKVLKLDKEKVKEWLLKNSISPDQRAENLEIKDWLSLTKKSVQIF